MRFSAGLSVLWVSPFGPINVSFAKALNDDNLDETEVIPVWNGYKFLNKINRGDKIDEQNICQHIF